MTRARTIATAAMLITCAGCLEPYRFRLTERDAGDGATRDGAADADAEVPDNGVVDVADVVEQRCPGNPIDRLLAFDRATCAIRQNNVAFCWGSRVGALVPMGSPTAPIRIGTTVQDLVIGGVGARSFVCFIENSSVFCAGDNSNGQVARPPSATPIPLAMPNRVAVPQPRALSAGSSHVCVLHGGANARDQRVSCWGYAIQNRTNQPMLVDPMMFGTPMSFDPVPTSFATDNYESIHSAGLTNYVLLRSGASIRLVGWGNNAHATFPVTELAQITPTTVLTLGTTPSTALTGFFVSPRLVCHTNSDTSNLRCIGTRDSGVLGETMGDRTTMWQEPASTPRLARDQQGVPLVGVGSIEDDGPPSSFACVVTFDEPNQVRCIGSNRFGQLGGTPSLQSTAWVSVGGAANPIVGDGSAITHIATGPAHGCVRTTNDNVYCWGRSGCGERGDAPGSSSGNCFDAPPAMVPSATERAPNRVFVPCGP